MQTISLCQMVLILAYPKELIIVSSTINLLLLLESKTCLLFGRPWKLKQS